MVTSSPSDRIAERRRAVVEQICQHAIDVMTERGVGGLTISEVARRMGIRQPSMYKYFPSLHALYDELFARAASMQAEAIGSADRDSEPGLGALRASIVASVRLAVANPALAQLFTWRPIPDFEPSAEAFAPSQRFVDELRGQLRDAVKRGELVRSADSDEALRLLSIIVSGLVSQQLANEPDASYDAGAYSALTEEAFDMFVLAYKKRRS